MTLTSSTTKVIKKIPVHRIGIYHTLSARNIKNVRDTVLKKHKLSSPEWFTLAVIAEQDDASAKSLAQELEVNPTYITATLSKLKQKKLLDSKISISDSRVRDLQITTAGQQMVDTISMEISEVINNCLGNFSSEKLDNYFEIIKALSNNDACK
jgi:DNA-binding MarR family transcriptional regulator